jgi:hypothetical protein
MDTKGRKIKMNTKKKLVLIFTYLIFYVRLKIEYFPKKRIDIAPKIKRKTSQTQKF